MKLFLSGINKTTAKVVCRYAKITAVKIIEIYQTAKIGTRGNKCLYSILILSSPASQLLYILQGPVKPLVCTGNIREALARIGEAVDTHRPVLLQGQIGSGEFNKFTSDTLLLSFLLASSSRELYFSFIFSQNVHLNIFWEFHEKIITRTGIIPIIGCLPKNKVPHLFAIDVCPNLVVILPRDTIHILNRPSFEAVKGRLFYQYISFIVSDATSNS